MNTTNEIKVGNWVIAYGNTLGKVEGFDSTARTASITIKTRGGHKMYANAISCEVMRTVVAGYVHETFTNHHNGARGYAKSALVFKWSEDDGSAVGVPASSDGISIRRADGGFENGWVDESFSVDETVTEKIPASIYDADDPLSAAREWYNATYSERKQADD